MENDLTYHLVCGYDFFSLSSLVTIFVSLCSLNSTMFVFDVGSISLLFKWCRLVKHVKSFSFEILVEL